MEVNFSLDELISSALKSLSEEDSSLMSTSEHNGADSQHLQHTHDQNIPNTPATTTERCTNGESSNLATMSPSTSSEHFNDYHYSIAPDTYLAPLLSYQDHHQNSIQMPNGSQTIPQMPRQINHQNNRQMHNGSQTMPQMPRQINNHNSQQIPHGSQTIPQMPRQINYQNSMQMLNGSHTIPQIPRQINHQNGMQMSNKSETISEMPRQINHQNHLQMPNRLQIISEISSQINHQNVMQMPNGSQIITQSRPSFNIARQPNIQRRPQVPTPPVYHSQSWSNRRHKPIRKPKRSRTIFTTEQLLKLEKQFQANQYLERSKRLEMAGDLVLGEKIIKVWFQNRRMKEKRDREQEPSSSEFNPNVLNSTINYASIDNEGFQFLNPLPANSNNEGYSYLQNTSNGSGLYPQQILTTNGELPQITISREDLDNISSDSF